LLRKLSNGVEKYEIEVTKMGQNYSCFLTVKPLDPWQRRNTLAHLKSHQHTSLLKGWSYTCLFFHAYV